MGCSWCSFRKKDSKKDKGKFSQEELDEMQSFLDERSDEEDNNQDNEAPELEPNQTSKEEPRTEVA